jgi:hypothetical protein
MHGFGLTGLMKVKMSETASETAERFAFSDSSSRQAGLTPTAINKKTARTHLLFKSRARLASFI